MSNSWSGKVAKGITGVKRPRAFWNIFFSGAIIIILMVMLVFIYQVISDYAANESEQIFVEYKDEYLITDKASFKIPEKEEQEISIYFLTLNVKSGEKINLSVSKITGDLLEVEYMNETVYKKVTVPIAPTIVACVLLVFPILGLCIFMLIITNIKNPGKKIAKLQSQFLLKIHR